MAAKNPRLTAVVEPIVYDWVLRKAGKEGVSASTAVGELLKQAYDADEEAHWARVGEERLATFRRARARKHEDIWKAKA